jgi:ribonucleoside-triphosphate reductase
MDSKFKEITPPWGEIGYITFKRTYARRLKEDDPLSKTEEFWQVIERELEASEKQLNVGFTEDEKKRYAELRMNLKFSTAGRFMWQLGTKTVDRLGLPSLQNCAFTVVNSPIRPFTWCFEMLMLGSGVGYNIQKHNVYQLPKLKNKIKIERKDTNDADFIVPDSREGWVKLLGKVLKAHFYGGEGFTYSTVCIRSKGAVIKGFGGTASGPEDLCWGISEINKILNSRSNKKLRPIDCLDIMNIIGNIVVAGNVRRSAQIAIGDFDDIEFLKAKRWDLYKIPNWRAMSNNSIVAPENIDDLPKEFWDTYNQGEPYGLINLELARSVGRTGENQYPDPEVEGFNPCKPLNSLILTNKGYITFEQALNEDELTVLGIDGQWKKATKPFKTGENRVVNRILLSNGSYLYGTDNHLHMDRDGNWVRMDKLEIGNQLKWENKPIYTSFDIDNEEDYKLGTFAGWVQGDGWYSKRLDNVGYTVGMCFGINEMDVVSYFEQMLNVKTKPHEQKPNTCLYFSSHRNDLSKSLSDIGMPTNKMDLKWLYGKSKSFKLGFIRAIFTADGSVRKMNNVELYSVNRNILEVVSTILNEFGIHNTITTHNNGRVYVGKDGKMRNNSTCFKINVYAGQFKQIGFLSKFKNELLEKHEIKPIYRYKDYVTVIDIEPEYSVEDVYDITVNDETHAFYDTGVVTHNCAEQSLANFETCCLAEVYLPNIETYDQLLEALTYAYRMNKHSLALKCSLKETEEIVNRNMRMGIGMTGVLQATEEQRSWLSSAYEWLRKYDVEYSKKHGFPNSIKLTTIKPSGTLSLLAGVTPGVHPNPAGPYYIRRIRISSQSTLIDVCRKHGFPIEYQRNYDGTEDKTTMVISFPCKLPDETPVASNYTWKEQLDMVRRMQAEWSDNSVSCTVYYKKEDIDDIKNYLREHFKHEIKTVSFLLYYGHGFDQAPYETITKEQYDDMIKNIKQITSIEVKEDEFTIMDCDTGACPIK